MMTDKKDFRISDIDPKQYTYELPEELIAKFPSAERGKSRMLAFRNKTISHHIFSDIGDFIDEGSLLMFNNTKVIPARLLFHKQTGALIEVFLLEPVLPGRVMSEAMNAKGSVAWKCMIGNAKKWKDGQILNKTVPIGNREVSITAEITDRQAQLVSIKWSDDSYTFSEIVEAMGKVPLPPYIDREVDRNDSERYQTVYSKVEGAVAAPTAGLHFTTEIIDSLSKKSIKTDEVTLHVSAGTFQPLKAENLEDHPMHSEQIIITRQNLLNLIAAPTVIAVGTTSMRTLESTYWYGVKLIHGEGTSFFVEKLSPYHSDELPAAEEAFQAVIAQMDLLKTDLLVGETEIFIFPGYEFKVCDGLITNFHLPGSTLILLVAAFIGERWKEVYNEALQNQYKFLSYGDSSILFRK